MRAFLILTLLCSIASYASSFGPGQSGVGARSAPSSGGGGGISTINGLTDSVQSFGVGSSGTDFHIGSSGGAHTWYLPDAGASARGVVTTGAQTFAGVKTFSSAPNFSSLTASRVLTTDASKNVASSSVTTTELGALISDANALKVGSMSGHIEAPSAKTYTLEQYAEFAYTINRITIDMGAGTATAKLTIDGVDVTGCTSISASTTESTTNCTAANSVSVGNTVALVVTSPSSAADMVFTVKYTR